MAIPEQFRGPVRDLVRDLAADEFEKVGRDGRAGRTTAAELRDVVKRLRATLVELPDEAFELGDAGEVRGERGRWWLVVPVWTKEEGRSDLSLELTGRGLERRYTRRDRRLPHALSSLPATRGAGVWTLALEVEVEVTSTR